MTQEDHNSELFRAIDDAVRTRRDGAGFPLCDAEYQHLSELRTRMIAASASFQADTKERAALARANQCEMVEPDGHDWA